MNNELYMKTSQKIAEEVAGLLEEHQPGILAAMATAFEKKENGKIKVPVTFAITLAPMGEACGVKVKISYGGKTTDESECSVDNAPTLPGMEEKKHVKKFVEGMAKAVGPGGSVEISGGGKTVKIEGK